MSFKDFILYVPHPEILFGLNADKNYIREKYLNLAKLYHPDKGGDLEVFQKINALYEKAKLKLSMGKYGQIYRDFELGHFEIRDTTVDFYLGKAEVSASVVANSERFLYEEGFFHAKYPTASDRMDKEVSRYLPKIVLRKFNGDEHTVSVEKSPRAVLLRDVLDFYRSRPEESVPAVHVAWILSSMYNLYCYFNYAKIVHCDISLDTYFILPEDHSCQLLGGWWYAKKLGERITQIPARTFSLLPFEVTVNKLATPKIDGELIKACGRELLGDVSGKKLKCPTPMSDWLNLPSNGQPIKEYENWSTVLQKSFGARRFSEMNITAETLYGKR